MKSIVGVDLGGTNVRVILGDCHGRIIRRLEEKADKSSGAEGISRQILRMIRSLKAIGRIASVGIGSAGPLDLKEGAIVNSPHYTFKRIPLLEPLKGALRLPIYLANDCVAAVVGEKEFAYGKRYRNIVYVTISSGIGAGVIVDDRVLFGKDGNAHEVGHITIDQAGKLTCGCGKKGHWEAYCSGDAAPNFIKLQFESKTHGEIERSALHRISGGNLDTLSSRELFVAARRGDSLAQDIVEEMGRLNAIGFANVTNIYDPEVITVGGAIALVNRRMILEPVKQLIDQYSINRVPKIRMTTLGRDAVLCGTLRLSKYLDHK